MHPKRKKIHQAEIQQADPSPLKQLAPGELAELARLGRESASYDIDPELRRIQREYSIPEVIEMVQQAEKNPKRTKGRPAKFDRNTILDLAAKVRAEGGAYTRLAPKFKLSAKQLTNLVERNRRYFDRKVRELRG